MHGFGGPEVLGVDEVDVPEPSPGEVLVKVAAAGVAYGDIMKRQGGFGSDLPLPAGIGLQVAGTLAALGSGVRSPALGTRVMAFVDHGYAEYAIAPAAAAFTLPDSVQYSSAAALPVQGLTAYQTLRDTGRLQPGESVLVHAAAGGVGSLAVQLARLLGAETVIGTASRPAKLDHIRGLGTTAVDYTETDWPQQVLEATGGRGVNIVLDSVGGRVGSQSLECLAPFGRIVVFGAASGLPAEVPSMALMHNNQSITGYSLGAWLGRGDRVSTAMNALVGHVAAGRLTVPVLQEFPLEKAEEAHRVIALRDTIGATALLAE